MTSCDDKYARYVLVNLANIHNTLAKNYDIHFYLLQSRVSVSNLKLITDYAQELDLTYHTVHVEDDEFIDTIRKYSRARDRERYYDGMCHLFLPADVNRALYIDTGDFLFCGDEYPFYFEDFGGKTLLVSTYWGLIDDSDDFERIGLWGGFNSGHVLFDVDKMRMLDLHPADYVDYAERWAKHFPGKKVLYGGDQAFLTGFFGGDIATIQRPNPYNVKVSGAREDRLDVEPQSIHFNGSVSNLKPWHIPFQSAEDLKRYEFVDLDRKKNEAVNRFFSSNENERIIDWWNVCKRTPVYDELKRESFTGLIFASRLCKYLRRMNHR